MQTKLIKLFSLICIAVILVSSVGVCECAGKTSAPLEELSNEVDILKLMLDEQTGQIAIENLKNGDIWLSTPQNAENDELASGITRTNLLSRIVVRYKKGNSLSYTNDYTGSVLNGDTTYEVNDNRIIANYKFANEGFLIPVEYSVKGDIFSAKILAEQIVEEGDCLINSIELLPFFGAGGTTDEGFMLVPDGSGAVINFNNGKSEFDQYSKQVFGEDISLDNDTEQLNNENILIASFGIKNNNSAFIAHISSGAACAEISAAVAGQSCSYNRVYTSFCYRNIQSVSLSDIVGKNVSGMFSGLNTASTKEFCVNYKILDSASADLSGMAEATYQRLKENGVGAEQKSRLVLDLYGGVNKEKAFLGIRYTGIEKLTTYGDVLDILDTCQEIGIDNVDSALRYFSVDDIKGKISTGFKFTTKLGKKSDYKELISKSNVYPYVNINKFSKGSLGYNRYFTAAMGLDLVPVEIYDYSISNRTYDENGSPAYLIPYTKLEKAVNSVNKSIKNKQLQGMLVDNLVGTLYSDFAKKGILKDGAQGVVTDILNDFSSTGVKFMMSAPNEYAFKYADLITDLPTSSSGYGLFDYDVPFCQMALHGLVDYSSEAVNLNAMSKQQLLQIVKTGSQLKFSVIKNGGKSIVGTELEYLSSADFDDIKEIVAEWYQKLSVITSATSGARIVSYTEKDGISVTTYDNNTRVYVNLTEADCEIDSVKILSMDYAVVSE